MQREQAARPDLQLIWVGSHDQRPAVVASARKHQLGPHVVFDEDDAVAESYRVNAGAGVAVITRDGRWRARLNGTFTEASLRALLDAALAAGTAP